MWYNLITSTSNLESDYVIQVQIQIQLLPSIGSEPSSLLVSIFVYTILIIIGNSLIKQMLNYLI